MLLIIRQVVGITLGLSVALWAAAAVAAPPHDESNNIICDDCHSLHAGGFIPRGEHQEAVCKSCHNPTGIAAAMSDVANHLVHGGNTIIDLYPLASNHWYKMRVLYNSYKTHIPVDIWLDDMGEDGQSEQATQLWAGYINTAKPDIQDSSSCRWGALPGDYMAMEDQVTYIGSPPNHSAISLFKGAIDWISWAPVADYSGVDDAPHY